MLIDFHDAEWMTVTGMNNGTGIMSDKMSIAKEGKAIVS